MNSTTDHAVTNLLVERERRRRPALHFATAVDALTFAANALEDLYAQAEAELYLPADEVLLPIGQCASVVRECLRLHDERSEVRP